MNKFLILLFFSFCFTLFWTQGSYAPNASEIGTTAIHKDSSIFTSWANNCSVIRGWQNILDTTIGKASSGNANNAIGKSGVNGTVSLGDNGVAILMFEHPIFNGIGYDFAIFENAFNHTFLELAYVEVSTNGIDYVRFPNYSETQDTAQIGGFEEIDASNIYNLAGKYMVNYGTPFDLEELTDSLTIDINNINFIKIIDIVGVLNNSNTSFDNNQNQINDPFPTPYPSSGFDLDAVGVIHEFVGINEQKKFVQSIYPNPSNGFFTFKYNNFDEKTIIIFNNLGTKIRTLKTTNDYVYFNEKLTPGVYFVKTIINNSSLIKKVIIY